MEAVLTVRLDKDLKDRSTEILKKHGSSPSQAVRTLFERIARTDTVPFEADAALTSSQIKEKIRAFDRCHTKKPITMTDDEIRAERLRGRYGIDV